VTFRVHRSQKSRRVVLRASGGESLPDALLACLRQEQVSCGWLRASGVLVEVELRVFDAALSTLGRTRRFAGPVQVLMLEGGVGLSGGEPSVSLRGLLAHETDARLETVAGEIASARIVALEGMVDVFDDLQLERSLDESAGIWLFRSEADGMPQRPTTATRPAIGPGWTTALEASAETDREPGAHPRSGEGGAMPAPIRYQRQARPGADLDAPVPEPGDIVEHFAFGLCDVVKSDGDRLHLRVHKDGRIREIALEMLRVARLDDATAGTRRFRLERRI
jgi:predicted DNA-binding protein with PD1-like motif